MTGSPSLLHKWIARMRRAAWFGIVIAFIPLVPALIGLAFDSQYLQSYHWLLFYSFLPGIFLTVAALIVGLVLNRIAKSEAYR